MWTLLSPILDNVSKTGSFSPPRTLACGPPPSSLVIYYTSFFVHDFVISLFKESKRQIRDRTVGLLVEFFCFLGLLLFENISFAMGCWRGRAALIGFYP